LVRGAATETKGGVLPFSAVTPLSAMEWTAEIATNFQPVKLNILPMLQLSGNFALDTRAAEVLQVHALVSGQRGGRR